MNWPLARLTLRNTRNLHAKEHPLAIFKSILKSTAGLSGAPEPPSWGPLGPVGRRIHRDRAYDLLLLWKDPAAPVQRFLDGLGQWLQQPRANFTLESISREFTPPSEDLPAEASEICLLFHTPLPFTPATPGHQWDLRPAVFLDLLDGLLASLDQPPTGLQAGDLQLLAAYWHYAEFRHRSKSGSGFQYLNGGQGPLYLRAAPALLQRLWPALQLAALWGLGPRVSWGQGRFRLLPRHAVLESTLLNPDMYLAAWDEYADQAAPDDTFFHSLQNRQPALADLTERLREGTWSPGLAQAFPLEKPAEYRPRQTAEEPAPASRWRLCVQRAPLDRLLAKTLHRQLSPIWDRLFEAASFAYRPGRSVEAARAAIAQAIREGYTHAVESDIVSYFDEIPWDGLETALDRALPQADVLARQLIRGLICGPVQLGQAPLTRDRGILQGCPLSPLLANLYLDSFDERVTAAGHRLIRYGDDFLILCQGQEAAERALEDVSAAIADLGLRLHPEKTSLRQIDSGISFLGLHFDDASASEARSLEKSSYKKTLWLTQPFSYAGLDHETIYVRKNNVLLARLPLLRIREIIVLGNQSLSSALLRKCSQRRIPVSFTSAFGHYSGTLRPDSRAHYARLGAQAMRHAALALEGRLVLARRIVAAKAAAYHAWLRLTQVKRQLPAWPAFLAALERADSLESLRGVEGAHAKRVYPLVNSLVKDPAFRSSSREPRKRADPWNAALDFAYSMLFGRLNVLLRTQGLNPYLGFLHSHLDHFESLVCDLQEAFRSRVDRLLIKCVNRRVIVPEDFEPVPPPSPFGWRFVPGSGAKLIQAFERELEIGLAGEPGTLGELLHAQIQLLCAWADADPSQVDAEEATLSFFAPEIPPDPPPKT